MHTLLLDSPICTGRKQCHGYRRARRFLCYGGGVGLVHFLSKCNMNAVTSYLTNNAEFFSLSGAHGQDFCNGLL